jgi:hypothetical protein
MTSASGISEIVTPVATMEPVAVFSVTLSGRIGWFACSSKCRGQLQWSLSLPQISSHGHVPGEI